MKRRGGLFLWGSGGVIYRMIFRGRMARYHIEVRIRAREDEVIVYIILYITKELMHSIYMPIQIIIMETQYSVAKE